MRILLAHSQYRRWGGEDVVFDAEADLLRRHGHDVFCLKTHNDDFAELGQVRRAASMLWNAKVYHEASELIERHRIEVVHIHNTFPAMSPAVIYAARGRPVAVVQSLHNYRLFCARATFERDGRLCHDCVGSPLMLPALRHRCYHDRLVDSAAVATVYRTHRLLGTWHKRVHRFITPSERMRQRMIAAGLPSERIHVKQHFLANPTPTLDRRRSGILFVGRLSREKGLSTLLTAWRRMEPHTDLTIVGEGPEESLLREASANLARIHWRGLLPKEEILRMMESSAALIAPSTTEEPFGLVVIEALSSGLPVIASRVGAFPEIVEDGKTGLLFQPGDPIDLANKIERYMSAEADHPEFQKQARAAYELKYQPETNHELLIAIYRDARQAVLARSHAA